MTNIKNTTLRNRLDGIVWDVQPFIYTAVALVEMVERIHRKRWVIRDLSPDAIMLLDLNKASLIEERKLKYAYLSPEQTGRMNRTPDARSDLYALGVIYYEMLAGCLPLQADRADDWLHAHLAIVPKPLGEVRPDLQGPLADIVMKLLSKTPDERYQSASGLLADLKHCVSLLEETGEIMPFRIGITDDAARFQLPRVLFGREAEEAELWNAYEQTHVGGPAFVWVTGRSGSGKTTLVRQLQLPVMRRGGRFIAGKCDLMNRDIPYEPILQALRSLVRQIWQESPGQITAWKSRLATELGLSASIIAELIPEATPLLGELSSVEVLQPAEAVVRFRWLFSAFLQIFADTEQPLVMFLDDLQWADPATLDILREWVQESTLQGFMLIGTHRIESDSSHSGDGEEHAAAWLNKFLLQPMEDGKRLKLITMGSLPFTQVNLWVASVLGGELSRSRRLAKLLYQKTGGNPLYLHRLLDSLYREKKLTFDAEQAFWTWNEETIKELPDDQDVLQLIGARIRTLPSETIELLGIAGAMGQRFRLSTVALVSGKPLTELQKIVQPLLEEGLLFMESDTLLDQAEDRLYSFMHDRIQQAAYAVVPEEDRAGLHRNIGYMLQLQAEPGHEEQVLFELIHHLNLGIREIKDQAERRKLAEYNLQAALKSKATTAYVVAQHFLETGLLLLGEDESGTDPLFYRLLLELSECEYVGGRPDRAEELLQRLMERTVDPLQRSGIYLIRVAMYAYLKQEDKAVAVGLQGLGELGWSISAKPSKAVIGHEMIRTFWALKRKGAELQELPISTDPMHRALSDLVMAIAASAFISNPEVAALLYAKFVRYGLQHGNNEAFTFMLVAFAMIQGIALNRYSFAYQLLDVAFQLSAQFENTSFKCRLHFAAGLIEQYRDPIKAAEHFEKSARYGLESGDLTFAGFSVSLRILNHTGDLRDLSACVSVYEATSWPLLDEVTRNLLRITRSYIDELEGKPGVHMELDELMNGDLSNVTQKNQAFYACTSKIQIAYLNGAYREALSWVERTKFNSHQLTLFQLRKQHFYQSLSLASLYEEAPLDEQRSIRTELGKQLRSMKKWTEGDVQRSASYLLILTETMRVKGDKLAVTSGYEHALTAAREERNVMIEALVCERMSSWYRMSGILTAADAILAEACSAYSRWGAIAKAKQLREHYSGLSAYADGSAAQEKEISSRPLELSMTHYEHRSDEYSVDDVDEDEREYLLFRDIDKSVMKQAAGWPGGVGEGSLMERFLESAIRYAGAGKGYVLSMSNAEGALFTIEAAIGIQPVVEAERADYAATVVRYVVRTAERVVLANASLSPYMTDPYIRGSQPRSILCMTLPHPGKRHPYILYLENNLVSGIFREDRLDVLDILFSRMVYLESLGMPLRDTSAEEDPEDNYNEATHSAIQPLLDSLTNREAEILRVLSSGLSNKEIAVHFGLTEGTVKNHVFNIYSKLGIKRRAQAIARARELRILD
ncbi:AAA family ATPase [Paenibacillus periandrae]|uniref:AAA family ATPase n=1 Tax=Paenibacillus periandrae TaxID=1761741 RepID=UPI0023DD9D5C|nr:AAA family ATPase [Paenibacillus periandrae]